MSAISVAGQLGIRPGTALWFTPIEWLRLLGPLPSGVTMTGEFAGANVAVAFVSSAESVQFLLRRHGTVITVPPAVWFCAPAHDRTTFNRTYLGTILAGHGLHAVAEIPIDAAWTAVQVGRPRPHP